MFNQNKRPQCSLMIRVGWAPQAGCFKEKNLLPPPRIEPQYISSPACTLDSMLTELLYHYCYSMTLYLTDNLVSNATIRWFRLYSVILVDAEWIKIWEACGEKQSWPNVSFCPGGCLQRLQKTMRNLPAQPQSQSTIEPSTLRIQVKNITTEANKTFDMFMAFICIWFRKFIIVYGLYQTTPCYHGELKQLIEWL